VKIPMHIPMSILGQETAFAALDAHLQQSDGAGSVLILGPEGVGRFGLALHAARTILGTTAAAAARVDSLQHVDLGVLDPSEGIDGVRAAAERLSRRPAEGARQVLILRDLDRMSEAAHNALLKTLEEPPAGAALLALAEAAHHLPETVVSRCRIVRAQALNRGDTTTVLAQLGLPAEVATRLATDSEGSPGRAVFLHENKVPEAAERIVAVLGVHPEDQSGDPLGEMETILRRRADEKAADQRHRLSEVLRVVALRLRDGLPETEIPLRSVVAALGSMAANANPAIVLSELALHSWKTQTAP